VLSSVRQDQTTLRRGKTLRKAETRTAASHVRRTRAVECLFTSEDRQADIEREREMSSRSRSDVELMLSTSQSGASVKDEKGNTVFDSSMPEAYSTLDTAQKEHAKYHSHQVKSPAGSVCTATGNNQPNQAETDPLYQFNGISPSEGSVSVTAVTVGGASEEGGGGSGGGVVRGVVPDPPPAQPRQRLEAANILYEDSELPADELKHRGVHANSYSLYGRGEGFSDHGRGSYITFRCRTKTLVVAFCTALAILLAVTSLVLSALLWFGVYDSPSPSPSPPTACNCPSQAQVQELRTALDSLKLQVHTLKNRSSLTVANRKVLAGRLSQIETNLTHLSLNLSSLPTERGVVLPGLNIFQGCETRTDAHYGCNLVPVSEGSEHYTCVSPGTAVEEEGSVLVSAGCVKDGSDTVSDGETISATLELYSSNGVRSMRCRCSRILLSPGASSANTGPNDPYCSLRQTRCPLTAVVNATLVWHTESNLNYV
jgi:hypothetical protein